MSDAGEETSRELSTWVSKVAKSPVLGKLKDYTGIVGTLFSLRNVPTSGEEWKGKKGIAWGRQLAKTGADIGKGFWVRAMMAKAAAPTVQAALLKVGTTASAEILEKTTAKALAEFAKSTAGQEAAKKIASKAALIGNISGGAISVVFDTTLAIHKYWKGDITGWEATGEIVASSAGAVVGTVAGIGAEALAVSLGAGAGVAFIVPIAFVGVSLGVGWIVKNLWNWWFQPSVDDLYQKQCRKVGVSPSLTAIRIQSEMRRALRKHHPDKGGKEADFVRVKEDWDKLLDLKAELDSSNTGWYKFLKAAAQGIKDRLFGRRRGSTTSVPAERLLEDERVVPNSAWRASFEAQGGSIDDID